MITATHDPPAPPRITRALALPPEQINATPPRMPGDSPAHHLPARGTANLTTIKDRLPEI